MQTISNRLRYGWAIVAIALFGCWDSVATPIRVRPDGGADRTDAGEAPRDAAVIGDRDVPDTPYCDQVANWLPQWTDAELALVDAINELRESRPRCGNRDALPALWPLPELRCAARVHSRDLDLRESVNIELKSPQERVGAAGLRTSSLAEIVVTGGSDELAQVLDNLRESPEYCDELFEDRFIAIGIGLYKEHWTLDFAGFGRPP